MKFILIILGIIVLLVLFFVFFPLRVVFEYSGKAKVKVFAYGLKVYDSRKDLKKDTKKDAEQKPGGQGDNTKKQDAVSNHIEELKKNFEFLKQILKLIVEKAKKYAIIKNIEVKYRFGLYDAAVTGIYSGVVYGVVNGFAAFLRNYFKINNQKLEVIPDFDNNVQEFKVKIELVIRVIFFIPVFLKVKKLIKEKKEV